jgi:hypothetical protein
MKPIRRKTLWFGQFLLAGIACLAMPGCSSVDHLQADGVPANMDLHGVEPAAGRDKYDITSVSDINRGIQTAHDETLLPDALVQGQTGDWTWALYGTDEARVGVLSFVTPRTATIGGEGATRTLAIPSWDSAMTRFREITRAVIGDDAPPLRLQLDFYGEDTPVRISKTLQSDSGIPLYFAFSVPEDINQDETDAYRWLVDTLELVGHEYWHAYNMHHDPEHYVNQMTEEITAYTLQNCIKFALLNGQGGLELHDLGGELVDMSKLDELRQKQLATGGPAELSNKARLVAIYNIANLMKGNVIKKGDVEAAQKLYGLCFAMAHHPVDLTRDFYPADSVKPLNFQ